MKYRAIIHGLNESDGRSSLQIFGIDLTSVKKWAEDMAEKHHLPVQIFISKEELLETIQPK